jgi:tRNA-splicing ligase RtcB
MGDDAVIVRGVAATRARATCSRRRSSRPCTARGACCRARRRRGSATEDGARAQAGGDLAGDDARLALRNAAWCLRGGGLDEAPQAYRRLPEVLAAQEGTVEVLHTLRPLVVVMAGADEFDPYKD